MTTLMIFSHVCALMTLAFLRDAAWPAAAANPDGSGPQPRSPRQLGWRRTLSLVYVVSPPPGVWCKPGIVSLD